MNTNIVNEYISYIESVLYQYFHLLLTSYDKKLVKPFIDKYINVRYYNNTVYLKDSNFINRISKELNLVAKESIKVNKEDEETIKNICALFGYILYFDDCIKYGDKANLIKTLFADKMIQINRDEKTNKDLTTLILDSDKKKNTFFKLFDNKDFIVVEKEIKKQMYKEDIKYNFNVSKIYSDYAINKAFNTGTIAEDKIYVLYLIIVGNILKSAIDLDFSKYYIADFPETLYGKTKKSMKYLRLMDNELIKDHFSVEVSYNTYKKNKKIINNYINMGYNFALKIDTSYDNDIESLILFQYIIISSNDKSYSIIKENKDIETQLIVL